MRGPGAIAGAAGVAAKGVAGVTTARVTTGEAKWVAGGGQGGSRNGGGMNDSMGGSSGGSRGGRSGISGRNQGTSTLGKLKSDRWPCLRHIW